MNPYIKLLAVLQFAGIFIVLMSSHVGNPDLYNTTIESWILVIILITPYLSVAYLSQQKALIYNCFIILFAYYIYREPLFVQIENWGLYYIGFFMPIMYIIYILFED